MSHKIYVGNLSYGTSEESFRSMFEAHGQVESVKLVRDRETGRLKGFGFIEMATAEEAQAAIEALNGQEIDGRKLVVNEARPQEPRRNGGGGGGHRRHGGGGGGGHGRNRY
jgi:cold-inducible RNA-binding protein